MRRLESRVALVTGGSCGIGAAITRRFLQEGAKVFITDVKQDAGERLAAELGCEFLPHDVTSEEQWASVIGQIEARSGALHILVNNAGVSTDQPQSDIEHARLAVWQAIQRVNVEGVFLGCRAVIPLMRRSGGGSIVNMSSIAALLSNPDNPAYGASKAAVRHLTKSTAVYLARNGSRIRCNSVHPGLTNTEMLARTRERIAKERKISAEQVLQEFCAQVPTGALQEPEDIAHAVLFLASDEARQITGAQLVVDGGFTAQP